MRKKTCEIKDMAVIEQTLRRCIVGRLATNGADGYPYIVPLNFVYHDGAIYFHCSRQGEKMENMLRDPRVCFEVDIPLAYLDTGFNPDMPPCDVGMFYHSVIIRGRAGLIEDIDEKLSALNALMASHEQVPGYGAITADMRAVEVCAVVKVPVTSITAKSNLAQAKKDEDKARIADYLQRRNLPGDREAAELIRPR